MIIDRSRLSGAVLLRRPDLPGIWGAVLFRMWTYDDVHILSVEDVLQEAIENKHVLLNNFEFLVEDDAIWWAEGEVCTSSMESLFHRVVPQQGVINTFGEVLKPSYNFVIPAGITITRGKEPLWWGFIPVSSKWCYEAGIVSVPGIELEILARVLWD